MSMAVPGARLFTNEINLAISRASRSSRPLPLSGPLRREIENWLFLKSWSGFLPWRSERHHQFALFTDASSYRWAGVLNPNAVPLSASDYWSEEILSSPIAVKEALALSNALSSFASTTRTQEFMCTLTVPRYFMPGTANPLGPIPCRKR